MPNSTAGKISQQRCLSVNVYLCIMQLYGLYKQITVGDVNISKPGMFSLQAKYKWEAWKSHEGKSKEQAQEEYITEAERQLAAQSSA
jgi:diazepam-binding inhibitor (GABA receptor modulator, acyl-CoA-binding protein)